MRFALRLCVVPLLATTLVAQTAAKPRTKKAAEPAVTAADVQALKDALAAQQQQIEQLRQALEQRDQAWQQAQQQLQQAQSAATEAQQKAALVETAATEQKDAVASLNSQMADVQTTLTNTALNTQDDQKRFSALEGLVGRFRLSGDVRVRYENFFFDYSGCASPACNPRHRERIRIRLGIEGKLNEDFSGGLYIASGALENGFASYRDPVSTNETLTGFFERKAVGFDRGWITYNPANHKWLSLTGGKFAPTWQKTSMTFDGDLNPEGFSEKLSFNLPNPVVKNIAFTGLQILYNESGSRNDSFAAGGQVSGRLQFGSRVTITPSVTILNWRNADAIAAGTRPTTTTVVTSVGPPVVTSTITLAPSALGGNSNTNAPFETSPGVFTQSRFNSQFLYNDYIIDTTIKTPAPRFPIRLLLEYEKNLNARLLSVAPSLQDQAYWLEGSIGQQRDKNDIQIGYSFARVEQDAIISLFAESDMRAASNVLQHRIFFNWLVAKNTTIGYTWWHGRTLNANLPNAARPAGLPTGEQDPWLNRMQFDLIYKF